MDGTRAARARQRGFAPAGVRLGRRLAVASVLVLAACSSKPPPSLEPVPVVQVVRPDGGDQDGAVRATGVFRWTREAALSFAIPGTITRLLVDQGDVVTPGQLVAVIDPTAVQARTAQTAADLQQARKDLERYEPLLKKGFISSQQYERLRTAAASAQAAHDTAVFDLKRARLVSQVRGAVLRRSAQAGEVVQAGQAVVTVADETSGLVLRVPISSREAPRLAIGAAAQIRLSDGSHMAGQVARIGKAVDDRTSTIEVDVAVHPTPGLRSGMIAQVDVAAAAAGPAAPFARLPAEAILEARGAQALVLLYDPATRTARRRSVEFGGFDGDSALVRGVPRDADVISAGAGFINDGERVSIAAPVQQRAGPVDRSSAR